MVSKRFLFLESRLMHSEDEIAYLKGANSELKNSFLSFCVEALLENLKINVVSGLDFERFGASGDGGYIMLNDLKKTDFLISAGIGDNSSFENALMQRISGGIAIDHTVPNFKASSANLEVIHQRLTSALEPNSLTLQKLIERNAANDYLLKLDIEGDEWAILQKVSPLDLSKFRQIIVEFHWLYSITDFNQFNKMNSVLRRLNYSHATVACSANNWGDFQEIAGYQLPDVIEVTYARRASYQFKNFQQINFDKLQFKNDPLLLQSLMIGFSSEN
jgi:hypothetical protein